MGSFISLTSKKSLYIFYDSLKSGLFIIISENSQVWKYQLHATEANHCNNILF